MRRLVALACALAACALLAAPALAAAPRAPSARSSADGVLDISWNPSETVDASTVAAALAMDGDLVACRFEAPRIALPASVPRSGSFRAVVAPVQNASSASWRASRGAQSVDVASIAWDRRDPRGAELAVDASALAPGTRYVLSVDVDGWRASAALTAPAALPPPRSTLLPPAGAEIQTDAGVESRLAAVSPDGFRVVLTSWASGDRAERFALPPGRWTIALECRAIGEVGAGAETPLGTLEVAAAAPAAGADPLLLAAPPGNATEAAAVLNLAVEVLRNGEGEAGGARASLAAVALARIAPLVEPDALLAAIALALERDPDSRALRRLLRETALRQDASARAVLNAFDRAGVEYELFDAVPAFPSNGPVVFSRSGAARLAVAVDAEIDGCAAWLLPIGWRAFVAGGPSWDAAGCQTVAAPDGSWYDCDCGGFGQLRALTIILRPYA